MVPKALREELGLAPGTELELSARDGRLEVEVPTTAMKLVRRGRGVVASTEREMPPLTVEQVRDTLEGVRH